jgi:hypothetical protein
MVRVRIRSADPSLNAEQPPNHDGDDEPLEFEDDGAMGGC